MQTQRSRLVLRRCGQVTTVVVSGDRFDVLDDAIEVHIDFSPRRGCAFGGRIGCFLLVRFRLVCHLFSACPGDPMRRRSRSFRAENARFSRGFGDFGRTVAPRRRLRGLLASNRLIGFSIGLPARWLACPERRHVRYSIIPTFLRVGARTDSRIGSRVGGALNFYFVKNSR